MSQIIFITGGCRSGKSALAQATAEALPGKKLFIATCPITDEEMRARIRWHQQARAKSGWETLEEETELAQAIASSKTYETILVDCLTLWINNLLYHAAQAPQQPDESWMVERCLEVIQACQQHPGTIILVSNEVGSGIVPDNLLARLFRDFVGRSNQTFAAAASRVVATISGIPLNLKG